ncbi:hypothetical protein C0992_003148, partial [Termitomyces sp. T32_za158]
MLQGLQFEDPPNVPELKRAIKNRKRARVLVYWFFSNHSLTPVDGGLSVSGFEALSSIYAAFLAHQAKLLVIYKREALESGLDGELPVKLEDFESAVDDCLRDGFAWTNYLQTTISSENRSFLWFERKYDITRVPTVDF